MAGKIHVLLSSLSPHLFINTASGRKEQQRKKEALLVGREARQTTSNEA